MKETQTDPEKKKQDLVLNLLTDKTLTEYRGTGIKRNERKRIELNGIKEKKRLTLFKARAKPEKQQTQTRLSRRYSLWNTIREPENPSRGKAARQQFVST